MTISPCCLSIWVLMILQGEQIGSGYRALGVRVKELGTQKVFSSILPIKGWGPGRDKYILKVNA